MIPFCRTIEEMEKVVKIMEDEGIRRGRDFKLPLNGEIPISTLFWQTNLINTSMDIPLVLMI